MGLLGKVFSGLSAGDPRIRKEVFKTMGNTKKLLEIIPSIGDYEKYFGFVQGVSWLVAMPKQERDAVMQILAELCKNLDFKEVESCQPKTQEGAGEGSSQ